MISAPNSAGTNSANCEKLLCSRSRKFMRWLRVGRAFFATTQGTGRRCRGRSVSRPPFHVEDGASMAFRADEPLTFPRVAQTERPATDSPGGKPDAAARTVRMLARRGSLPDLSLLIDGKL